MVLLSHAKIRLWHEASALTQWELIERTSAAAPKSSPGITEKKTIF